MSLIVVQSTDQILKPVRSMSDHWNSLNLVRFWVIYSTSINW